MLDLKQQRFFNFHLFNPAAVAATDVALEEALVA